MLSRLRPSSDTEMVGLHGWICSETIKYTIFDFFLFIFQRNKQNVFTDFCLEKKSRPLNFNFFIFFLLFFFILYSFENFTKPLAPFHRGK